MYNSDVLKHQDKHGSRKWGLLDLFKVALIGLILEITQSIHIMPPFMRNQTCDISQGSQSAYFPDGLIVDSFIALNTSKVLNSVNSNTNNFTQSSSWTSQCTFKFPELIPDDSSSKQPTVIESFAVSNNTDNYIWYNEECGGSAQRTLSPWAVWK